MAGQQLKFDIGSSFSGEGFKAAQQSVSSLNKYVSQGATAVNQLASALGGMDNTAGKAARGLAGMLNAFMTLNPVLIGITAAIAAVTWAINELNEREKEAKERADELRKSREKLAGTLNERILRKAITDANELSKEFERITKHANELSAAMRSLDSERSQGGILAIQAEKVVAVMNEVTDEGRNMVAAEYDYKIAIEKAAVARKNGEAEVAKAHQDIVDGENRIANLAKQREAVEKQVANLDNNIAYAKKHQLSTLEDDQKKMAQLRAKIEEIDNKSLVAKDKIQVLLVAEQTATAKMNNALTAAQTEVLAAKDKIAELKRHSDELAKKEAEKAEAVEEEIRQKKEKADRDKEEKELQKEAAQAQKDVNDAAKDVAAAERAYAQALAEYERDYANNKMGEAIFGQEAGKGLAVPVRIDGAVKAEIVSHDIEKAINEGLIRSVKEMDAFQRQRAKEVDKLERERWKQTANEMQKYMELQKKSQRALSKQDKDFMEKFDKISDNAKIQKLLLDAQKADLEAARTREIENNHNLRKVKEKMEKLGLK